MPATKDNYLYSFNPCGTFTEGTCGDVAVSIQGYPRRPIDFQNLHFLHRLTVICKHLGITEYYVICKVTQHMSSSVHKHSFLSF